MNNHHSDLLQRHKLNPILTAANWSYQVNSAFDPGASLLADSTPLLLCRVEDRSGHSHLCAARSANGIDTWEIDSKPTFMPDPDRHPDELWGIEDPRNTCLPSGAIYRLGLALFDLNEPERCLKPGKEWVFSPQEPYEQHGDVEKVVFPCGTTLRIYYGAADTSIAMATGSVQAMLQWLEERG